MWTGELAAAEILYQLVHGLVHDRLSEMHNLLADISPERIAREMVAYAPDLQF
jgi:hypothetical protein